jgi:Tfp pilus assembly protein PilF
MLENLGQWQQCRKELLDLAVLPDVPSAVYTVVAERLLEHGETASARVWLEKLKKREPNSRMTQALTARLAIADNDKPTAVAVARLLMPDPDQNKPVDDLGQLAAVAKLMEDLDFEKAAEQVLDRFAKESPDGILAKAGFLIRQKRFSEALVQLESAWGSGSHSQILQLGLQVVRDEGQPPNPESVAQLESWIARTRREDPESFTLLVVDAGLRELLGQKKLAIDIYRDALRQKKLSPTQTAVVSNNLAYLLADPSNAAEALGLVESAIEELGPHPDLLDTRAMVSLAAGETLRAVEDLNEAVIVPTATRYLHLAVAQIAARSELAAKSSLEKAKALGIDSAPLTTQDRTLLERVEQAVANAAGA